MCSARHTHCNTPFSCLVEDRGDFGIKAKVFAVAVFHFGDVAGFFVGAGGGGFEGWGAVGVAPEGPEGVVEVENEDGGEGEVVVECEGEGGGGADEGGGGCGGLGGEKGFFGHCDGGRVGEGKVDWVDESGEAGGVR